MKGISKLLVLTFGLLSFQSVVVCSAPAAQAAATGLKAAWMGLKAPLAALGKAIVYKIKLGALYGSALTGAGYLTKELVEEKVKAVQDAFERAQDSFNGTIEGAKESFKKSVANTVNTVADKVDEVAETIEGVVNTGAKTPSAVETIRTMNQINRELLIARKQGALAILLRDEHDKLLPRPLTEEQAQSETILQNLYLGSTATDSFEVSAPCATPSAPLPAPAGKPSLGGVSKGGSFKAPGKDAGWATWGAYHINKLYKTYAPQIVQDHPYLSFGVYFVAGTMILRAHKKIKLADYKNRFNGHLTDHTVRRNPDGLGQCAAMMRQFNPLKYPTTLDVTQQMAADFIDRLSPQDMEASWLLKAPFCIPSFTFWALGKIASAGA